MHNIGLRDAFQAGSFYSHCEELRKYSENKSKTLLERVDCAMHATALVISSVDFTADRVYHLQGRSKPSNFETNLRILTRTTAAVCNIGSLITSYFAKGNGETVSIKNVGKLISVALSETGRTVVQANSLYNDPLDENFMGDVRREWFYDEAATISSVGDSLGSAVWAWDYFSSW